MVPALPRGENHAVGAGRQVLHGGAGPGGGRRGDPGGARGADVAAHRAQHLHRQEAHRRQLRPAVPEGPAARPVEGGGCALSWGRFGWRWEAISEIVGGRSDGVAGDRYVREYIAVLNI